MPGKVIVYKSINDNGESYWPEVFTLSTLKSWENELGPISFASQYQSSPINLSGNDLKIEWLHWYQFDERPEVFEKIIFFIDPAISQKKSADYFALAVAGRANNRIYLLDLLRTKAPLSAQLDLIHDKWAIWEPDEIVVEAGGQQLYFVDYLMDQTMYNITVPDKNWHRSDKKIRFEGAAAHFNSSRALLPGYKDDLGRISPITEFSQFVDEWTQFPDGLHDDTLDAVAGAISALIRSTIAFEAAEPETEEETIEFVRRVYQDTHNRDLTQEELDALKDYYNDSGETSIRGFGFGDERAEVHIGDDRSYSIF